MKPFRLLLLLVVATMLSASTDQPVTIYLIGDSTMANKDTTKGSPERGWGMVLHEYFNDDVRIENHAVNGRSSKSFMDEGRWQRVMNRLKPGDYAPTRILYSGEGRSCLQIPPSCLFGGKTAT